MLNSFSSFSLLLLPAGQSLFLEPLLEVEDNFRHEVDSIFDPSLPCFLLFLPLPASQLQLHSQLLSLSTLHLALLLYLRCCCPVLSPVLPVLLLLLLAWPWPRKFTVCLTLLLLLLLTLLLLLLLLLLLHLLLLHLLLLHLLLLLLLLLRRRRWWLVASE